MASIAIVKKSFLRISGIRTEPTSVAITACRQALGRDRDRPAEVPAWRPSSLLRDDGAGAAGALDLLAGGLREAVCGHGQLLGEIAHTEDLDRHALPGREAALREGCGCHV